MTDDHKGILISIFSYLFPIILESEMVLIIIGIKNDETKSFGLKYTKTFRKKKPTIDFINFW